MSGDPGVEQPIIFHTRELTPSKRIVLQHAYFKIMKNDLGVDPEEWFNPLDSMPIATENGSVPDRPNRYADPERQAEIEAILESKEEEMTSSYQEDWFEEKKPIPDKVEDTMHEKMYRIATSRYNPFSVGGSENCDSDISCNIGGSERLT